MEGINTSPTPVETPGKRGRPQKPPQEIPIAEVTMKKLDTKLDAESEQIVENYKALILAIDFIRKRFMVPCFIRVQEGVENITGCRFDKSDLQTVISVWPASFLVEWKRISLEEGSAPLNYLCIYGKIDSSDDVNLTFSEKIESFR